MATLPPVESRFSLPTFSVSPAARRVFGMLATKPMLLASAVVAGAAAAATYVFHPETFTVLKFIASAGLGAAAPVLGFLAGLGLHKLGAPLFEHLCRTRHDNWLEVAERGSVFAPAVIASAAVVMNAAFS